MYLGLHSSILVMLSRYPTSEGRELLALFIMHNLFKLQNKIEVTVKNYMPLDHKEMGLEANLFAILIYSSSEKIIQSARFNERLQFNQEVLLRSYNINGYSTS